MCECHTAEYRSVAQRRVQIADVETDISGNLHWQSLDADIEIEALENPERFPLGYK